MEAKVYLPDEVIKALEEPIEKSAIELIAVGLYRDGKMTMRQAADLLGVNLKEMPKILENTTKNI